MHFSVLQNELRFINKTRNDIFKKFIQYQSLNKNKQNNQIRRKKAVIPLVGDIYGFLFGLTTDKNLNDIRRAINDLSSNQNKIKHVVEESLTIMNKSISEVKANRARINVINKGISDLYERMNKMAKLSIKQYKRMNYFIYIITFK